MVDSEAEALETAIKALDKTIDEANEDYTELFLVGNVANTPTAVGGRVGDFTVPIFFSRGVRGPRGQWYRAGPEEFVLECADPVVVSTSFGPVQRRRLSGKGKQRPK